MAPVSVQYRCPWGPRLSPSRKLCVAVACCWAVLSSPNGEPQVPKVTRSPTGDDWWGMASIFPVPADATAGLVPDARATGGRPPDVLLPCELCPCVKGRVQASLHPCSSQDVGWPSAPMPASRERVMPAVFPMCLPSHGHGLHPSHVSGGQLA
eukprot:scaffold106447_cov59-Phaeocystis_antarctica.AAC.4